MSESRNYSDGAPESAVTVESFEARMAALKSKYDGLFSSPAGGTEATPVPTKPTTPSASTPTPTPRIPRTREPAPTPPSRPSSLSALSEFSVSRPAPVTPAAPAAPTRTPRPASLASLEPAEPRPAPTRIPRTPRPASPPDVGQLPDLPRLSRPAPAPAPQPDPQDDIESLTRSMSMSRLYPSMPKVDFDESDDPAPTRPSTPPATPPPAKAPSPSRTSRFRPIAEAAGREDDFLTAARAPSTPPLRDPYLGEDVDLGLIEVNTDPDEPQFHGWSGAGTDRPDSKPSSTRSKPRSASIPAVSPVPDFEPPVDLTSTAHGTRNLAETTTPRPSQLISDLAPEPIIPPRPRPGTKNRPVREPVELSSPAEPIVSAHGISKTYGKGDSMVEALRGVDVEFGRGTFTVIMGPSGSGKSTLLHILAGLDRPSTGTITVNGKEISKLKEHDRTKFRRASVAFIFQTSNLLSTLTAEENILLPLRIAKKKVNGSWVEKVIENLNLDERLRHKPGQLTPSQQQRISVTRGLITKPAVLFADEPTGNLDSAGAHDVLAFLREAVDEMHQTILMVTHDPVAASYADRVLFLEDGLFVEELANPSLSQIIDTQRHLSQGV